MGRAPQRLSPSSSRFKETKDRRKSRERVGRATARVSRKGGMQLRGKGEPSWVLTTEAATYSSTGCVNTERLWLMVSQDLFSRRSSTLNYFMSWMMTHASKIYHTLEEGVSLSP